MRFRLQNISKYLNTLHQTNSLSLYVCLRILVIIHCLTRLALHSPMWLANEKLNRLRVTTTPFLTDRIIVPRLSEFWQAHPNIEISIFPSRSFVDILREEFDLAIRAIPLNADRNWSGVDQFHIARVSLIGIVSPSLLADGNNDARQLPWLWHEEMATKIELMQNCGLDVDWLKKRHVGSPNLLLEAVRQGLGAIIFNEHIARQEMTASGISMVPLPKRKRRPTTSPYCRRGHATHWPCHL